MITVSMNEILSKENVNVAIQHLKTKNNSAGIDGVLLHNLDKYWEINGDQVKVSVFDGSYIPGIVRQMELIQGNGKRRDLARMNAIDRLLMRCVVQKIARPLESILNDNSYAFREGRGTSAAVKRAIKYMSSGKEWVAEIDISGYFDNIDHELMAAIIRRTFADEYLCGLVIRYLAVRVEQDFEISAMQKGILQGNALSPLLSNLYLHELDEDLSEKGYSFIRYCDNINIYTKSYEDALNKLNYVRKKLSKKFKLDINQNKTGVFKSLDRKFLGHEFEKGENDRIYSRAKKKGGQVVYRNWRHTAIQKVDNNYHLVNDGILTRKDFTVLFENEDGKHYLPVETVDSLNIYSNVVLTGEFLKYAAEKKININIFDKHGTYIGEYISNSLRGSTKSLLKQASCYVDDSRRLSIAKTIIMAAAHNMRENVRYYKRRKKLEKLNDAEQALSDGIRSMNEARTVEELMLAEARTRQKYYSAMAVIISDSEFEFKQRTKRPPKDEVNAMISFGNTILYNRIATEIYKSHLDIRISFLHSANNRAESLNLDIAEIFKPIIVDRTIFTIINRGMLDKRIHFQYMPEVDGIYLSKAGREIFLRILEEKLYQKIECDGQKISYDTLIRREIKNLQNHIEKDEKYKAFKYY